MLDVNLQIETEAELLTLHCATPAQWVAIATDHLPELMSDHANCERKAAAMALSLMKHFSKDTNILSRLSKIAREELVHYEQVLRLMSRMKIQYRPVSASIYARELGKLVRLQSDKRLVDQLIICAIIESRSCERFSVLAPILPKQIGDYYQRLYQAEKRHAVIYLTLARTMSTEVCIRARLQQLLAIEARLVQQPEAEYRFHSGIPSKPLQLRD